MNGYKTYAALALAVATALAEGVLGIDVPGVDFTGDYTAIIIAALAAVGFRSALAKIGNAA